MLFFISFLLVLICNKNLVETLNCYSSSITSSSLSPTGCDTILGDLNLRSTSQTELLKFENIKAVEGDLLIQYNSQLTSLQGLNALETVTNFIKIERNYALTSLQGLNALKSSGKDLSIKYSKFTSLDGLDSFTTIGYSGALFSSLHIHYNDHLTTLQGMNSLTLIGTDIDIKYNPLLTDLVGLAYITSGVRNLWIRNNIGLEFLYGVQLTRLNYEYVITGNSNLACSNECNKKILSRLSGPRSSSQCGLVSYSCPGTSTFQPERSSCDYNSNCVLCDMSACDFTTVQGRCGDGIQDTEEGCDPPSNTSYCIYGQTSCELCDSDCNVVAGITAYCGDGTRNGTEECDVVNDATHCSYGEVSCQVCNSTCNIVAGITAYCGDGIRNGAEQCDVVNDVTNCSYGEVSCQVCNSGCNIAAGITAYCGDGIRNGAEECDVVNDATHCSYGEVSCQVCNSTCNIVAGVTSTCGDGSIDPLTENCESETIECAYGETCEVCANCQLVNRSGPYCGDGIQNGPEQCDETASSPYCNYGEISCRICFAQFCTLTPGTPQYCGDNIVQLNFGEECDNETDVYCQNCLVAEYYSATNVFITTTSETNNNISSESTSKSGSNISSTSESSISSALDSSKSSTYESSVTASSNSKSGTTSGSESASTSASVIKSSTLVRNYSSYNDVSGSGNVLDNCTPLENCESVKIGEQWIITYNQSVTILTDSFLDSQSTLQIFGNFSVQDFTVEVGSNFEPRVDVKGCFNAENTTLNLDLTENFPEHTKTEIVIVSAECIIGGAIVNVEASYQTSEPCIKVQPASDESRVAVLVEYQKTPCLSDSQRLTILTYLPIVYLIYVVSF